MKELYLNVGLVPLEKGVFNDDWRLLQVYIYLRGSMAPLEKQKEIKCTTVDNPNPRCINAASCRAITVSPARGGMYTAWRVMDLDYINSVKECIKEKGLNITVSKLAEKTAYMDALMIAMEGEDEFITAIKDVKNKEDGAHKITLIHLVPQELIDLFKEDTDHEDPTGLCEIKAMAGTAIGKILEKHNPNAEVRIGFNVYPEFKFELVDIPEEREKMKALKTMVDATVKKVHEDAKHTRDKYAGLLN